MPKKAVVITTCGTSLLTNVAREDAILAERIRGSANTTEQSAAPEQRNAIAAAAEKCRGILARGALDEIRKASAELNGLLGFYNNQLAGAKGDMHFLCHTDTLQGESVARVLHDYMSNNKVNVSVQSFRGLRTDTLQNFHEGLGDVIKWCHETLPGYRKDDYHVVFNLTGGFKSIQGWMQTLGMFYADEIIYIFEAGKELLRIPRIPINIDQAAEDAVRTHLPFFRKMAGPNGACGSAEIPDGLPETFIFRLGDVVELSPWGQLMWRQVRAQLYSEKLLNPPDPRVKYSHKFRSAADGLAPDQLEHVNERIDDLANYRRDRKMNPARLDYKPLRGNPAPPSTHEIDAWAQSPAWRIFLHTDGDGIILDDLGPGLH